MKYNVKPLVEVIGEIPAFVYNPFNNLNAQGMHHTVVGSGKLDSDTFLKAINCDNNGRTQLIMEDPQFEYNDVDDELSNSSTYSDSKGYIRVPSESAVVFVTREDGNIEKMVGTLFSKVMGIRSIAMFKSPEALRVYYSQVSEELATFKRIDYIRRNASDITESILKGKVVNGPAPRSRLARFNDSIDSDTTVALVVNPPIVIAGHHIWYERLWVSNPEDTTQYQEASSLMGDLFVSCTMPESIRPDGCLSCSNSSRCTSKILSEAGSEDVISARYEWIKEPDAKRFSNQYARASAMRAFDNELLKDTRDKSVNLATHIVNSLSGISNLEFVKDSKCRVVKSSEDLFSQASISNTSLDKESLELLARQSANLAEKSKLSRDKAKKDCSVCVVRESCRPYGGSKGEYKSYAQKDCTGPVQAIPSDNDPALIKAIDKIASNKKLYKAIYLYSGSSLPYSVPRAANHEQHIYRGWSAVIGHITSEEVMRSQREVNWAFIDPAKAKVEVSDIGSSTIGYVFSNIEYYTPGKGMSVLGDNSESKAKGAYFWSCERIVHDTVAASVCNTGILKFLKMPYKIDKNLEGMVARITLGRHLRENQYLADSGVSPVIYVPLQVALMALGRNAISSVPSAKIKDKYLEIREKAIEVNYTELMNIAKDPVLDMKAIDLYVRASDILMWATTEGGNFRGYSTLMNASSVITINPGIGSIRISPSGYYINSSTGDKQKASKESYQVPISSNNFSAISVFEGRRINSGMDHSVEGSRVYNNWWYAGRNFAIQDAAALGLVMTSKSTFSKRKFYIESKSSRTFKYKRVRFKALGWLSVNEAKDKIPEMANKLIEYYGEDILMSYLGNHVCLPSHNEATIRFNTAYNALEYLGDVDYTAEKREYSIKAVQEYLRYAEIVNTTDVEITFFDLVCDVIAGLLMQYRSPRANRNSTNTARERLFPKLLEDLEAENRSAPDAAGYSKVYIYAPMIPKIDRENINYAASLASKLVTNRASRIHGNKLGVMQIMKSAERLVYLVRTSVIDTIEGLNLVRLISKGVAKLRLDRSQIKTKNEPSLYRTSMFVSDKIDAFRKVSKENNEV